MAGRLSRPERRAQLLDVAHALVREDGTDALTLARLAERAGVSKPIAYDHFGTRSGLLAALFRSFDDQQVTAMRVALAAGADSLAATARVVAAAYLDCVIGPEYEEVAAALLAYEETRDVLHESRASFVAAYREAFAPYVQVEGAAGRAVLTGLVGAAEALAREMQDGTVSRADAVEALATIAFATLEPLAR